MTTKDYTPWLYNREFLKKAPKYMIRDPPPGPPPPGPPPPNPLSTCEFGIPFIEWMNNATVRQLLHIPDNAPVWNSCSEDISDHQYYQNIEASEWIYEILRRKYKILVYSGNTDGSIPTYGTQMWIQKIGWKVTQNFRPYFVDG